ncbi:ABC transporter ATP-binding protein [Prosthecomicrobium sp. N25]|uniref:ABC transporter ATP-binding protein n=1 Tax=Prosthecomicrobium sp. N25 TaxID=3129254 RepID=UPI003077F68B
MSAAPLLAAPLLAVEGLTVEIRRGSLRLKALDGISFAVGRGEVLGIVGESGAGKSVTGAAVVDLLVPPLRRTAGTITLAGERIDGLPPAALRKVRGGRVGCVFQDPMTSLNPVLTVGRQLADTMRAHLDLGPDEIRRRAAGWIARVGLPNPEATLARYPHQLSGGQRQRIVIALALCAEPVLVIADEPTTALDVSVQAHILELLKDLRAETGVAMMLITHDLGVIAKMADRVAVFYAGRIVEEGPVADIVHAPRHPYTAGLIGATPAVQADGTVRLEQIPGAMPGLGATPPGCAFHPRCPRAGEPCRSVVPALGGEGPTRHACFFPLGRAAS